jgi:hypothetical protein
MWYLIGYMLISSKYGFTIYPAPFYSQTACHQAIATIKDAPPDSHFGCVFVPESYGL